MHDGDEDLRCESMKDSDGLAYGSVYWHAPEMLDGAPTGPKNHAWSVGLIFARMLFGYNPVEQAVMRRQRSMPLFEVDVESRQMMRELIKSRWNSIEFEKPFKSLEPRVQELLADMLTEVAELRPSTEEALGRAVKLAEDHGTLGFRRFPHQIPQLNRCILLTRGRTRGSERSAA